MKIKKVLLSIISIAMAASISACSNITTSEQGADTATLLDKGVSLINEVDAICQNNEYISLLTTSEEITAIIQDIGAKDYNKPIAVFELNNLEKMALESISVQEKLSKETEALVKERFCVGVPLMLNGMAGTETLAATSMITCDNSFTYSKLEAFKTYLYVYDNGYSFMVAFVPQEDNVVTATVNVVINETLAKCTTVDEVTKFFESTMAFKGITVAMVTQEK